MTYNEIINYLNRKNLSLDQNVYDEIENLRNNAIAEKNETNANRYWCIRQIYIIQRNYLNMFANLKNKEYEKAWNTLEKIDIALSFLKKNIEYINRSLEDFNLKHIQKTILNYEKLFPYFIFLSREGIIKKEECSICGKTVSLRGGCKHKPGKLYMGEMCSRIVTDYQIIAASLVRDPFDKYAILHIDGQKYNYKMLETLLPNLNSPYDYWDIEELPMLKPEYKNLGRNDRCPCGSNKKYKKCCLGTKKIYSTHYKILLNIPHKKELEKIKYINTLKG